MTIRKCDRCGAEINENEVRHAYEEGIIRIAVVDTCHRAYDLCYGCLWDLQEWMRGEGTDDAELHEEDN